MNKNRDKSTEDIHKTGDTSHTLQAPSPAETSATLKLNLSMEVYSELARQALRRGCTPEQLVAQQIQLLANAAGGA